MTPTMPEWKARWVAALRSNEYPQARKLLRCPGGYCCLGVLADVHGARWDWNEDAVAWVTHFGEEAVLIDTESEPPHDDYLPADARVWLASTHDGDRANQDWLVWLNDDRRASFDQIADAIEAAP